MPFIVSEAAALHARLDALSVSEGPIDFGHELGKFPFAVAMRVLFGEQQLDNVQADKLYDDSKGFIEVVGEAYYRSPTPLHGWWLRRTKMRALKNSIETALDQVLARQETRRPRAAEGTGTP